MIRPACGRSVQVVRVLWEQHWDQILHGESREGWTWRTGKLRLSLLPLVLANGPEITHCIAAQKGLRKAPDLARHCKAFHDWM